MIGHHYYQYSQAGCKRKMQVKKFATFEIFCDTKTPYNNSYIGKVESYTLCLPSLLPTLKVCY